MRLLYIDELQLNFLWKGHSGKLILTASLNQTIGRCAVVYDVMHG